MSHSASPVSLRPEQIALQRQGRDLARWLIIVPVVLFLLFGCSHLALLAAPPLPSIDTTSKLRANYAPWPFATIPAISTGIVAEIARDQTTTPGEQGGILPPIIVTTFWSTPTPTSLAANPPPATATLSGSPAPTRTATPLSTVTSKPTVTATMTLTRTPKPTFTRTAPPTATATRTLIPLPTRTPTSAPTSTFTPVPPTNTSAPPPPPPTATWTWTPTRTPTSTAINTATNTPTVTNTLVPPNTPTHTPTPTETLTPTPFVCPIINGGTGGGGSSFSWSLTNSGGATVNLTSVSGSWNQPGDVWQSLDFGGSQVWTGTGINFPGGAATPLFGPLDLPTLSNKSLSFNFNNLTSGVTYSVSASFDNGCTVNNSFTNP